MTNDININETYIDIEKKHNIYMFYREQDTFWIAKNEKKKDKLKLSFWLKFFVDFRD